MKHVSLFAAMSLAMVLVGCGGGGGGGNKSPNNPTLTGTVRIEAVTDDKSKLVQDPTNFQINESYIFELVQYDDSGARRVVNPSAVVWSSSDPNATYGILGPNTGNFETKDRETSTAVVVEARYGGKIYKTSYLVKARQTRLSGRLVSSTDPNLGIDGVTINFYTPVSNEDAKVNMAMGEFDPRVAEVYVGQVVTWTNSDTTVHSVVSDEYNPNANPPVPAYGGLKSGSILPQGTYQWEVPWTAILDGHKSVYYHSSTLVGGHPEGNPGDGTKIGTGMAGVLRVVHNPTVMVKVGSVTSAYDGTFRASVPAATIAFQIDGTTVPLSYYHSVRTAGPDGKTPRQFDTETETCMPPVPRNLPQVGFKSFAMPIELTPKSSGNPPTADTPCYY